MVSPGSPAVGRQGHNGKAGESGAFGRNDLQAAAEAECAEVAQRRRGLQKRFGNSRMTGSGSAVFARAGGGERPDVGTLPGSSGRLDGQNVPQPGRRIRWTAGRDC